MLAMKLKDNLMYLPVFGFNSGKYDINANKNEFFSVLENCGVVIKSIVKKVNKYMSIKTDKLQFLDICNYLAPNIPMIVFWSLMALL